jgi:hypothetical protein
MSQLIDRALASERALAAELELADRVTFLNAELSLTDAGASEEAGLAEALDGPIDLLYADFDHYPHAVLSVLAKFLPAMAPSASIFIDSAATYLPSFLALRATVDQLNRSKVPAIFLTPNASRKRLQEIVSTREFTLVALPEQKDRNQNGLVWIRIEPANIVPYPLTRMRGLFSAPLSGAALRAFFEEGQLPEAAVSRSFFFEQFVRAAYRLTDQELALLLAVITGKEDPDPAHGDGRSGAAPATT